MGGGGGGGGGGGAISGIRPLSISITSKPYPAVALIVPAVSTASVQRNWGWGVHKGLGNTPRPGVYTRGWGTCPGLGCTQGVGAHGQVWGVHKGLGHIPRFGVYTRGWGICLGLGCTQGVGAYAQAWSVHAGSWCKWRTRCTREVGAAVVHAGMGCTGLGCT